MMVKKLFLLLGVFITISLVLPTVHSAVTTTKQPIPTTVSASPTSDFTSPTSSSNITAITSAAAPEPTSNSGGWKIPDTIDSTYICPPPLFFNKDGLTIKSCTDICCIPCPATEVFYEPNKLTNIYDITSIIRIVSGVGSLMIMLAYLATPSRRHHPHVIIIVLAAMMAPFDAMGTIWLKQGKDLLCHSATEIASMGNNLICGIQGKENRKR